MNSTNYRPVATNYDKSFPLYITTIGETANERFVYRPSGIENHQLLYTSGGRGKCYIRGKKYYLEPGTIFYLPAGSAHYYEKQTDGWHTYWLTFNGTIDLFGNEPAIWHVGEQFDFVSYHSEILKHKNTSEWSLKSSVGLYNMLVTCKDFVKTEDIAMYNLQSRLDPVIDYLYEHCTEQIDVSQIAELIGVSGEHFCRIFKEFTNMRPFEYITHLRIDRAKEIMTRNPELSVSDVASMTGYTDNSYFIKKFRSLQGISPGKYKKFVCGAKK